MPGREASVASVSQDDVSGNGNMTPLNPGSPNLPDAATLLNGTGGISNDVVLYPDDYLYPDADSQTFVLFHELLHTATQLLDVAYNGNLGFTGYF